jgi:hypothetical protein
MLSDAGALSIMALRTAFFVRFGVFLEVEFLPAEAALELFTSLFHMRPRESAAIEMVMPFELYHLVVKPDYKPSRNPLRDEVAPLPLTNDL